MFWNQSLYTDEFNSVQFNQDKLHQNNADRKYGECMEWLMIQHIPHHVSNTVKAVLWHGHVWLSTTGSVCLLLYSTLWYRVKLFTHIQENAIKLRDLMWWKENSKKSISQLWLCYHPFPNITQKRRRRQKN